MHHISSFATRWWVAVDLIEAILEEGIQRCDEVEVFYANGTSLSLSLKGGTLHSAELSRSWGVGIRIIEGGKIGFSSTSDPGRWQECLEAARESGLAATQQEWKGLPGPVEYPLRAPTNDPSLIPGLEPARQLADALLEGAGKHPVIVTGGSVDLSRGTITLANSRGVRYTAPRTLASISLETIHNTSTGYEFDASVFMDLDARAVGEKAAFLASHCDGGSDIPTGDYDLVLSPLAIAQLLGHAVVPALSGRNVHAGRSRLSGELGKQCMDEGLSIYDDPFAKGTGATDWDGDGIAARRISFVNDGVLERFAYDLKTASRYGTESTASAVRSGYGGAPAIGVHNLVVDGERSGVLDEKALYVHDLVGAHTANPLTGDFSVELSNAYWVEGGIPGTAVRKAMYAGNIFEALRSIGGLGRESRVVGSAILPPVRLNKQRIIGK